MKMLINWWPFYPYTVPSTDRDCCQSLHGLFYDILLEMLRTCQPYVDTTDIRTEKYSTQPELLSLLANPTRADNQAHVYLPISIRDHPDGYLNELQDILLPDTTFLPVLESPGSVHFYMKKDEAVGSDLAAVIFQGWPMLIVILLGAGYSGIIIWLLDRLWNPTNFPKPFIRGFWEGFWWAFVTMTTVGYGDTTPRSLQARMYGLIWIVIGITILSVFTATVTTVMTQQSIGSAKTLKGITAAVLNGTDDFRLAITHGAKPEAVANITEMRTLISAERVEAGLLDQYAFASQQQLLQENTLIQTVVLNPTVHGIALQTSDKTLITCSKTFLANNRYYILQELQKWIKPLTIKTTTVAESAEKLFQPRTVTYMWYCFGAWGFIFILFVLWEFLYWRPKHRRRKAMKAKLALEQELQSPEDSPPKKLDQQQTGKPIIPKSVQNIANKHLRFKSKAKRQTNQTLGYRNYDSEIPMESSYSNVGFQEDNENSLGKAFGTDVIESKDLHDLIRRQNFEMEQLQEEYESWREAWAHRVHSAKQRHREEQRQLLRSLQRRQYENIHDQQQQFAHIYSPHMGSSYPLYAPTGVYTMKSTSRSVATTYSPYGLHRVPLSNLNPASAMPVESL